MFLAEGDGEKKKKKKEKKKDRLTPVSYLI